VLRFASYLRYAIYGVGAFGFAVVLLCCATVFVELRKRRRRLLSPSLTAERGVLAVAAIIDNPIDSGGYSK